MGKKLELQKEKAIESLWNLADTAILLTSKFYSSQPLKNKRAKRHYQVVRNFIEEVTSKNKQRGNYERIKNKKGKAVKAKKEG